MARRERWVAAAGTGMLLLLGHPCAASAAARPSKYEECERRAADSPTLSHKVFPLATFAVVDSDIGWEGPVRLKQKIGRERLRLSETVDLTVVQNGCEDYVVNYEFRLTGPAPAKADQAYWLERAAQLIGQVEPGNLDSAVPLKRMREALRRRAAKSRGRSMPAQGFEEELDKGELGSGYDVTLKRTRSAAILTVAFWEAL